jgi:thioredoxin 1
MSISRLVYFLPKSTNIQSSKPMKTIALTAETFDSTINTNSPQTVLVDFWAEWCGPCKMLAPTLEQLATEHEGRATIAKVDIDAHPELAARFNIQAIPTLIIFKNGQPTSTITGLRSKDYLTAALAA